MKSKVKVLHVIDALSPGGAERVLIELVTGLHKLGVPTGIGVTRTGLELASSIASDIEILVLGRRWKWDATAIKKFVRFCNQHEVAILHAHGHGSMQFCALVKFLLGSKPKLIFHDHLGATKYDQDVPFHLRAIVGLMVDRYIGVSNELHKWAVERLGVAPRKASVLGNAIDLRRFEGVDACRREELPAVKQPLLAVVVAHLRPEKNHPLLFEALARSELARERLHVLVVGKDFGDDYGRKCRLLIRELKLEDSVTFCGLRMDVPRIMCAADFGLLSSSVESGPLTLLEYMAAGLPFIVTRIGQIARTVHETGLPRFVEPDDVASYARELDRLVSLSVEERTALSQRGRQLITQLSDLGERLGQLCQIYQQLGLDLSCFSANGKQSRASIRVSTDLLS